MKSVEDRFMSKVAVRGEDDCWEWEAARYPNGYGAFRAPGGKQTTAHRIAYKLFIGDLEPGQVVCHTCDNRSCVNPRHLFAGTQQDNMDDMAKKGRRAKGSALNHRPQKGSDNHNSKLNEFIVLEIRRLYDAGMSQADIARELKVSRLNIWNVVHRKSWNHI